MGTPGTAAREIRELAEGESHLGHAAMKELRPRVSGPEQFAERVDHVLRQGGYRLLGAFIAGREQAVAVAGFRVADSLAWGRYLYIDDISTAADSRRQGHAGALLEWLLEEAGRLDCDQLHLDSGTGRERFDAHRLYHRHRLAIHSHHFARGV